MQVGVALANTAAVGGAEGDDGFAGEIPAFQKCADNAGRLTMPNGVAQQNDVIICKVWDRTGQSRPGAGVVLLLSRPAVSVGVIKIFAGIGFFRLDFVEIGF